MQPGTQNIPQATYRTLFWLLLTTFTVFRLIFADKFGLGVDESHYLLYSRRLAWGYFDHPPMVAFLAALTTLFGESVFFARLGPIVCTAISLVLLRQLSLELYKDERVAFGAVVLLHIMPYQHLLMVALLPDATLNLFWCATLLSVRRALKTESWPLWILTGLMFGAALLSKYHAILLAGCLLGYFISSPTHRRWLTKGQPWIAVLIGLVVFAPNILWNARNEWISYVFQAGQGVGDGLSPTKFFLAVLGQFGVWSPVVFGLLIAAVFVLIRRRPLSDADRFVVWTSIPVFGFFCLMGLTSKILPHWTAAGWWTGSIATVVVILRRRSRQNKSAKRWRRWSAAALVTGVGMSILLYLAIFQPIAGPIYTWARQISLSINQQFPSVTPLTSFEAGDDISNDLFGWEETAGRVEAIRARMPRTETTFVFGHRFHLASQLGVYLHPNTVVTTLYRKSSQYRIWFDAERYIGWDAVFVVEKKRHQERAGRYRPLFAEMDPQPERIQIFRNGQLARELAVYKYYGFKGRYED